MAERGGGGQEDVANATFEMGQQYQELHAEHEALKTAAKAMVDAFVEYLDHGSRPGDDEERAVNAYITLDSVLINEKLRRLGWDRPLEPARGAEEGEG